MNFRFLVIFWIEFCIFSPNNFWWNFVRISRQVPEQSAVCRFCNQISENKLEIFQFYSIVSLAPTGVSRSGAESHQFRLIHGADDVMRGSMAADWKRDAPRRGYHGYEDERMDRVADSILPMSSAWATGVISEGVIWRSPGISHIRKTAKSMTFLANPYPKSF